MGIFSRFADIVNANINALLDKAEDPEKLIRLIIQEMEDTLVEVRTTSARTIAEKKQLTRRAGKFDVEAAEWEKRAQLALEKGREDLAKSALIEKSRAVAAGDELKVQIKVCSDTLHKLGDETSQLQEKLSDAKSRQKAILMRQTTANSRLKVKKSLFDNTAEDALSRFEQFERKLDSIEAEADSYEVGRKKDLAEEINSLQAGEEIEAELAAMKAQLGKTGSAAKKTSAKKSTAKKKASKSTSNKTSK